MGNKTERSIIFTMQLAVGVELLYWLLQKKLADLL